ncbi:hypothetical protein U9M48_027032 [Paspalum notatum var. saurae]|uniref:Uncharacterized protein n=1 Tax=Paspalum notatum var. saurae TaxID=547442 RepID=A0AAQ3TTK8_PASNO
MQDPSVACVKSPWAPFADTTRSSEQEVFGARRRCRAGGLRSSERASSFGARRERAQSEWRWSLRANGFGSSARGRAGSRRESGGGGGGGASALRARESEGGGASALGERGRERAGASEARGGSRGERGARRGDPAPGPGAAPAPAPAPCPGAGHQRPPPPPPADPFTRQRPSRPAPAARSGRPAPARTGRPAPSREAPVRLWPRPGARGSGARPGARRPFPQIPIDAVRTPRPPAATVSGPVATAWPPATGQRRAPTDRRPGSPPAPRFTWPQPRPSASPFTRSHPPPLAPCLFSPSSAARPPLKPHGELASPPPRASSAPSDPRPNLAAARSTDSPSFRSPLALLDPLPRAPSRAAPATAITAVESPLRTVPEPLGCHRRVGRPHARLRRPSPPPFEAAPARTTPRRHAPPRRGRLRFTAPRRSSPSSKGDETLGETIAVDGSVFPDPVGFKSAASSRRRSPVFPSPRAPSSPRPR